MSPDAHEVMDLLWIHEDDQAEPSEVCESYHETREEYKWRLATMDALREVVELMRLDAESTAHCSQLADALEALEDSLTREMVALDARRG